MTASNQNLFRTLRLVAVVAFLMFLNRATAQVQTARYTSMISNSNAYWEYLPEGYDSGSDTYPLLLCIHGFGNCGNGTPQTMPDALNGLPGNWIRYNSFPRSFTVNGKTFKFIVVTPQFINWPTPKDIDQVLDYLTAHYRIDTKRMYMTGFSMGGGVCWEYAGDNINYANRLAAIVPVCAGSSPDMGRARNMASANLPIWATHNDGDDMVPVSYTTTYINYINQAPAPTPAAKQTIFHAQGHDAWYATYNPDYREGGLDIYEWMLQYQRGGTSTSSSSQVAVPIINQAPRSNAGGTYSVTLPTSSLTLLGSGTDADGRIASYQWSKVSGPGSYRLVKDNTPNMEVYDMVQGTYTFRLTVTDDKGATASDDATVTVNGSSASNQSPRANAGGVRYVTLPTSSLTLLGSGSDADGRIVSYSWSKVSGPDAYRIPDATIPNAAIYSMVQGTYVFRLTVTDDKGATASDDATVTVNGSSASNQSPRANAGGVRYVTLPTSSLTLLGSGSDADGSIASYQWSKVSGPGSYRLVKDNTPNMEVYDMVQGTYTFRLTVTDDRGATASDDATVMVNGSSASNQSPRANAGGLRYVTLPTSSLTLLGSGTDADGRIASYQWSKVSGPGSYRLVKDNTPNMEVYDMVQGTYTFRLTVTDDRGATASDDATVTVGYQTYSIAAGNNVARNINDQTGISAKESFTIFPNPVNDYFVLQLNNQHTGRMNVQVVSVNGSVIKQFSLTKDAQQFSQQLPVSNLSRGTYFIKVQIGTWTDTQKMIKL